MTLSTVGFRSRIPILAILMTVLAGSVSAQVSIDDRRCIQAINKGVRKVAGAENTATRQSVRDFLARCRAATSPAARGGALR